MVKLSQISGVERSTPSCDFDGLFHPLIFGVNKGWNTYTVWLFSQIPKSPDFTRIASDEIVCPVGWLFAYYRLDSIEW